MEVKYNDEVQQILDNYETLINERIDWLVKDFCKEQPISAIEVRTLDNLRIVEANINNDPLILILRKAIVELVSVSATKIIFNAPMSEMIKSIDKP